MKKGVLPKRQGPKRLETTIKPNLQGTETQESFEATYPEIKVALVPFKSRNDPTLQHQFVQPAPFQKDNLIQPLNYLKKLKFLFVGYTKSQLLSKTYQGTWGTAKICVAPKGRDRLGLIGWKSKDRLECRRGSAQELRACG